MQSCRFCAPVTAELPCVASAAALCPVSNVGNSFVSGVFAVGAGGLSCARASPPWLPSALLSFCARSASGPCFLTQFPASAFSLLVPRLQDRACRPSLPTFDPAMRELVSRNSCEGFRKPHSARFSCQCWTIPSVHHLRVCVHLLLIPKKRTCSPRNRCKRLEAASLLA